jgi:LemA protein
MAMAAKGPEARAQAENMLTGTLKSLFAVAEQYPQLRAIESFTQLQTTLSEIEDYIQNSRRFYNAVVRDFNTKLAVFPSNIIGNMFNFEPREFFELGNVAEREAPKVAFGATS